METITADQNQAPVVEITESRTPTLRAHGDEVLAQMEARGALEIPEQARQLVAKARKAIDAIDHTRLRPEVAQRERADIEARLRENLAEAFDEHEARAVREDAQALARLKAEAAGEVRAGIEILTPSETVTRQHREALKLRQTSEVPGLVAAIQAIDDADVIGELLEGLVAREDDFGMQTAGRVAVARLKALSKAEGQDDGPARRQARAAMTTWDEYQKTHPSVAQRQAAARNQIASGQNRRRTDFDNFRRAHGLL